MEAPRATSEWVQFGAWCDNLKQFVITLGDSENDDMNQEGGGDSNKEAQENGQFQSDNLLTELSKRIHEAQNHEQRMQILLENDRLSSAFESLYTQMKSLHEDHGKDTRQAASFRQIGNQFFNEKKFEEAAEFYTKAILSDEKCSQGTSLSFANRSATFFHLEKFEDAIKDADEAIKLGYPSKSMGKLLIRKANSLKEVGRLKDAKQALIEAQKYLDKNPDEKRRRQEEIDNLMSNLNLEEEEEDDEDDDETVKGDDELMDQDYGQMEATNGNRFSDDIMSPLVNNQEQEDAIKSSNDLLPSASDSVKMIYDAEKGRHIVAVGPIEFGDCILIERPFASVLYADKFETHCQECFKKLDGHSLPCLNCDQVRFCSESCRTTAWDTYHQHECCKVLDLLEDIGVAYLALRILFIVGLRDAITQAVQEKSILPTDWPQMLYNHGYKEILSLTEHHNNTDADELLGCALSAAFLLQVLKVENLLSPQFQDPSSLSSIGSLIIKHLIQFSSNLISIMGRISARKHFIGKYGLENDDDEEQLGIAIYPTVSLLNHSCEPNVLTLFNGSKMIVKAGRKISPGQEICYCYGPSAQSMSYLDRQKKLKDQYNFTCQCEACASKKENVHHALRCKYCGGPFIMNLTSLESSHCLECNRNASSGEDLQETLDHIGQLMALARRSSKQIDEDRLEEAVEGLVNCNEQLSQLLYKNNISLCKVKEELCRCLSDMKQYQYAIRFSQEALEITKNIFGNNSYQVLFESLKLISLRSELSKEMDEELSNEDPNVVKKKKILLDQLVTLIDETEQLLHILLENDDPRLKSGFFSEKDYLRHKREQAINLKAKCAPSSQEEGANSGTN